MTSDTEHVDNLFLFTLVVRWPGWLMAACDLSASQSRV